MDNTLLTIGGIFHLCFVIFHIMFWKIFQWKRDLKTVTIANRGIMQILNLRLTYIFLLFAYLSIFFQPALLSTDMGKVILIAISIFWFMRAIEQIVFFKLKTMMSWMMFILPIAGAVIYLLPAI